jgi:hypothetical protein
MPSGRIDWSELHARLGAAHAAARELSLNTKGNCGLPGGFTEWKTAGVRNCNPQRPLTELI